MAFSRLGALVGRALDSWVLMGAALLLSEAVLVWGVVLRRKYTEIDFKTYMQQVEMVLDGERDYSLIRGDQGPIVYPAGFVWLYGLLRACTRLGTDVARAQTLFGVLYLVDVGIVARIYALTFMRAPNGAAPTFWGAVDARRRFPACLLCLVALSRRAHSVFALRLFNDAPCATLTQGAVLLLVEGRHALACVLYSLAVSVKMSALLYAPAWYAVLAAAGGHAGALRNIAVCAATQAIVGLPFLLHDPVAYVKHAFNLGRGFKHHWSVNFKWVPCAKLETVTDLADCAGPFSSTAFKVGLLALHVCLLLCLAHFRWLKSRGGLFAFARNPRLRGAFAAGDAAKMLFAANFVGIACARSLHFQFCVWYANTLPLLLWSTALPLPLRLAALIAVEIAWNPWGGSETSSFGSSLLLTGAHALLLAALFFPAAADADAAKKLR